MAKPRAMYCNQMINPANILRFAALNAGATEEKPLILGNAEFWIGSGSWEGSLIHNPPTNQWDKESVQSALNAYLADKTDALKTFLDTQHWPEGQLEVTK